MACCPPGGERIGWRNWRTPARMSASEASLGVVTRWWTCTPVFASSAPDTRIISFEAFLGESTGCRADWRNEPLGPRPMLARRRTPALVVDCPRPVRLSLLATHRVPAPLCTSCRRPRGTSVRLGVGDRTAPASPLNKQIPSLSARRYCRWPRRSSHEPPGLLRHISGLSSFIVHFRRYSSSLIFLVVQARCSGPSVAGRSRRPLGSTTTARPAPRAPSGGLTRDHLGSLRTPFP